MKDLSESHVTWAAPVPILVFSGLSVLEFDWMYATDRQTDGQTLYTHGCLMPPTLMSGTITKSAKRVTTGVLLLVLKRLFPHKIVLYARISYP